jgi:hypothetical protein
MIRTKMGMHNRSEMVVVHLTPYAVPPHNNISYCLYGAILDIHRRNLVPLGCEPFTVNR